MSSGFSAAPTARALTERQLVEALASCPQLCDGGPLISIVYCCDPRRRRCAILEAALGELGLTVERFVEVAEENRVPVKEIDGTGFGNLAFCPSPLVRSRDRDEAVFGDEGCGLTKYLEYKLSLLRRLIPEERLPEALTKRVVERYAGVLLSEGGHAVKAVLVGNLEAGGLRVLRAEPLDAPEPGPLSEAFLGVRLPRDVLEQVDALVKAGLASSRSECVRKAVLLFLQTVKPPFGFRRPRSPRSSSSSGSSARGRA